MRTLATVVGLAVIAACDHSGIELVVYIPADYGDGADNDPQVKLPDEVRLFVGLGDEVMTGIGPEGFANAAPRGGTYWLRDPNNLPDDVDRAPIGIDAPARFTFTPNAGFSELGVVVAVGYTNGEPTSSAAVFHAKPGDGVLNQYRMGLNGAADPRDPALRSRVNQLELWGANRCVYVDNRRSDIHDQGHRVAFIIDSAEDRDCDDLPEGDPLECNPAVFRGNAISPRLSCLADETEAPTGACAIGAPRCFDGQGDDGTCNRTRFCTAPAVCNVCANGTGTTPWDCAQDYQLHAGGLSSYGLKCYVPALKTAAQIQLCDQPITVTVVPPPGTTCRNAAVKALADPGFRDRFSLGPPGSTAEVQVTPTGCTLQVRPTGTLPETLAQFQFGALMIVGLDGGRGLAAPVQIQVLSSQDLDVCTTMTATCTWLDGGGEGNPNACVQLDVPR